METTKTSVILASFIKPQWRRSPRSLENRATYREAELTVSKCHVVVRGRLDITSWCVELVGCLYEARSPAPTPPICCKRTSTNANVKSETFDSFATYTTYLLSLTPRHESLSFSVSFTTTTSVLDSSTDQGSHLRRQARAHSRHVCHRIATALGPRQDRI